MYSWTFWARLYYRLSLLQWLSLRFLHTVAPRGTPFSKLPVWVACTNATASLVLQGLFINAVVQLRAWLPLSDRIGSLIACLVASLFLFGWLRRPLAVVVGMALAAVGSAADDGGLVALGAANVFLWLLLAWEARESLKVWRFKPVYLEGINTGSATVLRGKIHVRHVFLDTPRRRWRQRARQTALRQVERACRWMALNAKSYDVPLEFEHTIVHGSPVTYSGNVPTLENDYAESAAFETFLVQVIKQSEAERNGCSRDKATEPNECLVVHVAEYIGDTAYAVPRYRGQNSRPLRIEYTVIGPWKNAAVFAHELLHLFGANDFQFSSYHDNSSSRSLDEIRRKLLWRNIMFNCDAPLGRLAVDEQTAQCIGWL